jgi:hypothetical protein
VSFEGVDVGFCGPAYTAADPLQDQQEAINWYLEHDPEEFAKEPIAMLGAPGLQSLCTTKVGPVRGLWVLPGGTQALCVTSDTLYLVTVITPATSISNAQIAAASVGTLLTNSGPVCIRDNGVQVGTLGGYALIVDGTYGYVYRLSGAPYLNTFTGGVQIGLPTITFPGSLPNGLIVTDTATLSDTAGRIPGGTLLTAVDSVGLTATMNQNATGTTGSDTITLTIPAFGRITDPGFLGAQRIAFIEGWLICNQPGTRTFFTTGPTPYQIIFPPTFTNLKDSSTDNLITLQENNRELWLIGERTSEVWFDSGGIDFAFSRIPGVGPQIGCAAVNSITRLGVSLCWLARNEQGENIVVITDQYSTIRISNHGVEHAISQYPVVTDAIGYAYEEEGHDFYMLTFPTADVTWCFDTTTSQWHKRASWDSGGGQFHRHRSNAFMNFADLRIVGDYQNGQLHWMSRKVFTDNDGILKCLRRSPHVWQKANRGRVFFSSLQVEFTPGVGLQVGQGSNPQAMLRYSDDGGFNWSNEMWVTIGKVGETKNRAMWFLLGYARDRVWEVSFTDPVQRDVIGSTAFMEAAAA